MDFFFCCRQCDVAIALNGADSGTKLKLIEFDINSVPGEQFYSKYCVCIVSEQLLTTSILVQAAFFCVDDAIFPDA